MAIRLVLDAGGPAMPKSPDAQLLAAISKGRAWWRQLQANPEMTVAALARAEKVGPNHVDRILRLAFLSPKIVEAIIGGTVPANLTLERLKDIKLIALDWTEQHRILGITGAGSSSRSTTCRVQNPHRPIRRQRISTVWAAQRADW